MEKTRIMLMGIGKPLELVATSVVDELIDGNLWFNTLHPISAGWLSTSKQAVHDTNRKIRIIQKV